MAGQWVHVELCFYNLVEIRTGGGVCTSMCAGVCVCAHVYTHMPGRWMLLKELTQGRGDERVSRF